MVEEQRITEAVIQAIPTISKVFYDGPFFSPSTSRPSINIIKMTFTIQNYTNSAGTASANRLILEPSDIDQRECGF